MNLREIIDLGMVVVAVLFGGGVFLGLQATNQAQTDPSFWWIGIYVLLLINAAALVMGFIARVTAYILTGH